jgi:hypothetical protein
VGVIVPSRTSRTSRISRSAVVIATGVTVGVLAVGSGRASAADCAGEAGDLSAAFASGVDRFAGADYQRAIDLPDGRRLWTFQDAFVERPGGGSTLVHNLGVIQDGTCFDLLHDGDTGNPKPWIGGAATDRFDHWFWPMGATIPGDGTVRIFVAELEERGAHYLANATPVATWVATVDSTTLGVESFEPAPDPSAELFGWSVAGDAEFTYLYGHCYRQFGFTPFGHDGCAAEVTVARTSHDLTRPLEYWNGTSWVSDPSAAVSIAPTRAPDGAPRTVNPAQVTRVGDRWVAVTKDGDWWGKRIYVDVASRPTGPWVTVAVLDATADDRDENNYFANVVAVEGDTLLIGLSHNRWDGRHSDIYRPTFRTLELPARSSDPELGRLCAGRQR